MLKLWKIMKLIGMTNMSETKYNGMYGLFYLLRTIVLAKIMGV